MMATTRRCPVCRGSLTGVWGEAAAPNRKYCSQACRQQAYRQRTSRPTRRETAQRRAEVEAAAERAEAVLAELADTISTLRSAVAARRQHLAWYAVEARGGIEDLLTAMVAYDRAGGVPWAELAEDLGVDESTLRRRARRAANTQC